MGADNVVFLGRQPLSFILLLTRTYGTKKHLFHIHSLKGSTVVSVTWGRDVSVTNLFRTS